MAGADFTPEVVKVLDSKKVSDHHAIIPTMELAKADPDALPESEKNILTLAGARLLFATAEPHIYEAVTAVFSCTGQSFTTKGRSVCMNISRASGAGLCGVGSITLSGGKGSV